MQADHVTVVTGQHLVDLNVVVLLLSLSLGVRSK